MGPGLRARDLPGDPTAVVLNRVSYAPLDAWAYKNGIKLHFMRPGKPVVNAYAESFNGCFRDECLNQHWCTTQGILGKLLDHQKTGSHGMLEPLPGGYWTSDLRLAQLADSRALG